MVIIIRGIYKAGLHPQSFPLYGSVQVDCAHSSLRSRLFVLSSTMDASGPVGSEVDHHDAPGTNDQQFGHMFSFAVFNIGSVRNA